MEGKLRQPGFELDVLLSVRHRNFIDSRISLTQAAVGVKPLGDTAKLPDTLL